MARGTEQQRAVVLPERRVVGIHGEGVGRRFLHRERDLVTDAESLFIKGDLCGEQLLEARDVLGRDGEMDAHDASGRGVGRPFDQVLLDGLARPLGIGVEGDQALGLAAVVQPVADDGIHDRTVVGPGGQHGAKFGPEGELPDIFQQRVDALAAFAVVDELEQLLEHARGDPQQTTAAPATAASASAAPTTSTPSPGDAARTTFRKGNPRRKFSNWVSACSGVSPCSRICCKSFSSNIFCYRLHGHRLPNLRCLRRLRRESPPKKRISASKDSSMQISHTIELFRFESQS